MLFSRKKKKKVMIKLNIFTKVINNLTTLILKTYKNSDNIIIQWGFPKNYRNLLNDSH